LRVVLALFGPLCLLLLCGCGRSEPPAPAQSSPAAAPARDNAPQSPDAPARATAPATSTADVSSEFRESASAALRFIGEELGRGVKAGNQKQFDADLATAREKVKAARAQASTAADKDAALVLTLLLVKDKERYQTILLSRSGRVPYESVHSSIQQLYAEREGCARELRRSLGLGNPTGGTLRSGACLAEAKAAAAILDVK
jgi:hypothetical protein